MLRSDYSIKLRLSTNLSGTELFSTPQLLKKIRDCTKQDFPINDKYELIMNFTQMGKTFFILELMIYDINEVYEVKFDKIKDIENIDFILANLINQYIRLINDANISYVSFERMPNYATNGNYLYAPIYNFDTNSFIDLPECEVKTFKIVEDIDRARIIEALSRH